MIVSELDYLSSRQRSLIVYYVLDVASIGRNLHRIHQRHIDVHLLYHLNKAAELLICTWLLCPHRERQYLSIIKFMRSRLPFMNLLGFLLPMLTWLG